MSRSFTIEMLWNCPACGHKGNPGMSGPERESLRCVTCGYEKRESDEWIMPDSPELQPHLTGDLDRKARAGANWSCAYCKAESRDGHTSCEQCGAERDQPSKETEPSVAPVPVSPSVADRSGEHHREGALRPSFPGHAPECEECSAEGSRQVEVPLRDRRPPDPTTMQLAWHGALTIVALLVAGWCIHWLIMPREADVRIADVHWDRSEVLQERHDYDGVGWQDQEPNDVFEQHCVSRQRGTHDCHPHDCNCRPQSYDCRCTGGDSYECRCHTSCRSNRNGSASCSESCSTCYTPRSCSTCYRTVCSTCYDQCPTYENWCVYRYHQWDTLDHHELSRHDTSPQWPSPPFIAQHSLQRVLRDEHYHVIFSDDSDRSRTWDEQYLADRFVQFRLHQHWHVTYTHAGSFDLVRELRP